MGFFSIHLYLIVIAFLWGGYNLFYKNHLSYLKHLLTVNLVLLIVVAGQYYLFEYTRYSIRGSYDLLPLTLFISSGLILFLSTLMKRNASVFVKRYAVVFGILSFVLLPFLSWVELRHQKIIHISNGFQLRKETSDYMFRDDRFKLSIPMNLFFEKNFLVDVYLDNERVHQSTELNDIYLANDVSIQSVLNDTIQMIVKKNEYTRNLKLQIFEMDGRKVDESVLLRIKELANR